MTYSALKKAAQEFLESWERDDPAWAIRSHASELRSALASPPEPSREPTQEDVRAEFEAWYDEHRFYGDCKRACREAHAAGFAAGREAAIRTLPERPFFDLWHETKTQEPKS